MAPKTPEQVYQIKATLKNIHPPIWRRILVPDSLTLFELHVILQVVFAWENGHMHEFKIGNAHFSDPTFDEAGDLGFRDETRVKLNKLKLGKNSRMIYLYDFGDSWEHILLVEKVLPYEDGMELPSCTGGERCAPPDDSGGPWGYQNMIDALRDPQNKDHDSAMEWIGEDFDPEAFDLEATDRFLRQPYEDVDPDVLAALLDDDTAAEEEEEEKIPEFDPERLKTLLTEENDQAAQPLAIRQDMLSFLTYIRDNKITGTKKTGNLPRKAIAEIAARFVSPPPDLVSDEDAKKFLFRTEEDVWPVFFVHMLAATTELVTGGPDLRWRLTPQGEKFLQLPPVFQVWILFITWWFEVDWLLVPIYPSFADELMSEFAYQLASILTELPADQPTRFDQFVDQLIETPDEFFTLLKLETFRERFEIAMSFMVIDQLEMFGLLSTEREEGPVELIPYRKLVSFSITKFGRSILDTLIVSGEQNDENGAA